MRAFPSPLLDAVLVRRYRRFLADVRFGDGRMRTVHCPNPGAMTGCALPGSRVLVSRSDRPGRRLPFTWELVRVGRSWVCINTHVANRVVRRWLETRRLDLGGGPIRPEPRLADSRFDFLLGDRCVVEVKSVTLRVGDLGAFPDSVTARGRRHVESLGRLRGMRRILLFFVARTDVRAVRPADEIDPAYAEALRRAVAEGLEVRAVGARFSRRGVERRPDLPVIL